MEEAWGYCAIGAVYVFMALDQLRCSRKCRKLLK